MRTFKTIEKSKSTTCVPEDLRPWYFYFRATIWLRVPASDQVKLNLMSLGKTDLIGKKKKICGRVFVAILKNLFRYDIIYDARREVHYARRYLTSACLPVKIIIYLHLFCVVDLNDGRDYILNYQVIMFFLLFQ